MTERLHHQEQDTHDRLHGHGHEHAPPTILDPGACVDGATIAEWTGRWWTWGLQAPEIGNPLTDTTGAFAGVNNDGPVFYVAGTFISATSAERSFDVPAGKPVLLPMINFFDTEGPAIGASAGVDTTHGEAALKASMKALTSTFLANVTDLHAEIDGVTVKNPFFYREVSPFFSMGDVKPNSLLASQSLGVAAGTPTDTTISGGYWLMIDGLTPGRHTLSFGGSQQAFDFNGNAYPANTSSVVDHIKVV